MKYLDLHDEFIKAINDKIPRKTDLVNLITDTLDMEKDAVYRRLSGRINFSAREIGAIACSLNFSLDKLMGRTEEAVWLPFMLERPMQMNSMDTLFDVVDSYFQQMARFDPENAETGNLYCTLPMEYYLYSPILTKMMFFKWGHYFVGGDEFMNYSAWELPKRANELFGRLTDVYKFKKAYYIWDNPLIQLFAREIRNFHRMQIITDGERDEIKEALKDMLAKLEQCLNGTRVPSFVMTPDMDFYVSSLHMGFTGNYFISGDIRSFSLHTNFSFSMINNNYGDFDKFKRWIDSLQGISTLLSRSGLIERRVFFKEQCDIIDFFLS